MSGRIEAMKRGILFLKEQFEDNLSRKNIHF
jgi:hypothetical protein